MIDFRDLMLGDFVFCPKLGRALEVNSTTFNGKIVEFEGIPVTKEILKNIGFEEYDDLPLEGTFCRYWDKDYKYKLDLRNFWTKSRREWYIHIDNDVCNTIGSGEFTYVHELQNLVRINCKADLPITKEMIYGNTNE